ncbi:MAG: Rne/Rng family ribonuclease [Paracoccaceae bacterium]|jgi:ribonuclease E|nr:Rne/Rng family ribonuclease [Paracoccaceae bacterium]MDP7186585.1 Rne/Rng family ribonuclease [Paracoccaceae bacterium]
MAKKMLIDATHAEETRVVVVDGNKVEEFDFESENKRQLAGNIYLAKVTRVEPSLQAAFVDYGGNRHGFLAFSEIHPDYYQIPVADREALMAEERAYAEAQRAEEDEEDKPKKTRRRRTRSKAARAKDTDAVETKEVEIKGMETIDLDEGDEDQAGEGQAEEGAADIAPEEAVVDDAKAEVAETAEAEAEAAKAQPDASGDTDAAEPKGDNGEADPSDQAQAADTDAAEDPAEADSKETASEPSEDDDEGEEKKPGSRNAAAMDESIESVADDDDEEDIRPVRKPRPKRYKIQEVIKVRQILLVQVVKEERGNKGAALTTYLSLAGRYCVLMPNTARGGGISRKITNAADRKKLKEIANGIDVPQGAGLIVRTAGAKRTKAEIKRDYEYLQRLWEQIRELTLQSVAPAKIYEEGNLIKRSIRDLYNREIDEVLVEGERGYRVAKDFMKMIMPSHAKNVKNYHDPLPLFARYQVESYLGAMFNPTVQLKSGGYIVIGVTEALVAIDVNSGKATKEGSIEETALKTNLEAAEEVARQLRLRDLAGLIVIDFIDMDERKNNNAVEKKLKDKLKTDRARIQVGRISGFGLLEMSRQRLRPGMIEATTQPCPHCHGTGLLRSDDNLSLAILRQLEEEGVRGRSKEVLVRAPVSIANYLMNQKREHVAMIESRYGLSVRVEGDPSLVSPDFAIEKFKTATRSVAAVETPVVSVDTMIMDSIDAEAEDEIEETSESSDDEAPKKKRRRRRRRRKGANGGENQLAESETAEDETPETGETSDEPKPEGDAAENAPEDAPAEEAKPKKTRSRTTRSRSRKKKSDEAEAPAEADKTEEASSPVEEPAKAEPEADAPAVEESAVEDPAEPVAAEAPEPESEPAPEPEPEPVVAVSEPAPPADAPVAEMAQPDEPAEPKQRRRGWWSRT